MTLELYPASAHDTFHGTGIQYPAHIDEAVQQIYGACKGLGTDEQTLITVLGSKSPEVRNLVALRYKELYREPLKSLVKSETSGIVCSFQRWAQCSTNGSNPPGLSVDPDVDNSLTGKQRSAKQDMALRRTRRHNQEGIRRRHRLPNLRAEAPILQLKLRDRHQGIFPRSSSLDTLPNSHSSQATLRNNSIFNRDQDILRNNNSSSNRRSNQDIRINSRRPILLSSPATHRSNSSIRPSNHNQATVRRSIQVINRSNRGIRLNSNNRGILCSSLAILRRSRPILSSSSLATLLSNWDILLSSRDIRSLATHRNSSTLDTRQASRRTSNTHLPLVNQAIHHRTELAHPTKVVATLRQADTSSTQLLEDILRTEVRKV
ncbi:hypothetical protein KRP22_002559 [Phytophthora ramorum]|nr:Annexin A13 [Phytophthora ramorum]